MNDSRPTDLAPQPLDHATALPARYYVDPELPALERRAIFDRSWQLVAHVCQLRGAGDHVVGGIAGRPVLGGRGADGARRGVHHS